MLAKFIRGMFVGSDKLSSNGQDQKKSERSVRKNIVDVVSSIKSGFELYQQGSLDKAADIFEQVLHQDPNNVDALCVLGEIKGNTGKLMKR